MDAQRRISVISTHILHERVHPSELMEDCSSTTKSEIVLQHITPNGCAFLSLNRPETLNSLNLESIHSLNATLSKWQKDPAVSVIVIKGAGKAFCAGGDVRAVVEQVKKKNLSYPTQFFSEEYKLDYKIWKYPKPIVSLLNGVTMGGGVGLTIGTKYRIVTEKTLFAMPETAIGFFPDVGGSYFLSHGKVKGALGMYLALTGARLAAADTLFCGFATHFIPTASLPNFENELKCANVSEEELERIIQKYAVECGKPPLEEHLSEIQRCFDHSSLEDIFLHLSKENTPWAQHTLSTLKTKSPTSLKVVFQQLQKGKGLNLEECYRLEFRLAMRLMLEHDFHEEGVTAVLVEKRAPSWNPPVLDSVSSTTIHSYFHPLENFKELEL